MSRAMEVAPLRGLRFDVEKLTNENGGQAPLLTAPPYDVISPPEHQELLDASTNNVVRLTLGDQPGETTSYVERAALLERWIRGGVVRHEDEACFYVYVVDYSVPGSDERRRMLGFTALAKVQPFEDGVILPHEETFAKVVQDRQDLLAATKSNLESIFLLYSDPEGKIDAVLEEAVQGDPAVSVEAKPGEIHSLYPMRDMRLAIALSEGMRSQRPLIADGHHRYTTSLRYRNLVAESAADGGDAVPGAEWQMMTFTNLYSEGLSILATHRMLKLKDDADLDAALAKLEESFDAAGDGEAHIEVETASGKKAYRFPESILSERSGVNRTDYTLLRDVVIGDWLGDFVDEDPAVSYYKENTGETEALARGDGDILFRMRPVGRDEFQGVTEGGELFPHKTTYFYPKLWSGLVFWQLEEPAPLALK